MSADEGGWYEDPETGRTVDEILDSAWRKLASASRENPKDDDRLNDVRRKQMRHSIGELKRLQDAVCQFQERLDELRKVRDQYKTATKLWRRKAKMDDGEFMDLDEFIESVREKICEENKKGKESFWSSDPPEGFDGFCGE